MNIESQELKQIKKIYGEEMMHLCRTLFPTILEQNGLLLSILEKNLAPTKSFATEIKERYLEEEFETWIYGFIIIKQEKILTIKTPFELLKEKGYTLYECHTDEDIQSFKKYYAPDEELCTFNENRIERCYVFFAVKDNVEEIRRENFHYPSREDEYGTSVISIQFLRCKLNTLSIKNRYNHTVNNPDATFSNNLENIVPGLTTSFEKYYDLSINRIRENNSSFLTTDLQYIRANDGRYYRYNYEIRGIYYCENNIIIDHGNVIDTYAKAKERYIVFDYFVLDKKEKRIFLYDANIQDSFVDSINALGNIKDIISIKDGTIIIEYDDGKKVYIGLNNNNGIISYKNDYVEKIKNGFLFWNKSLIKIELSNAESIGNSFLYFNNVLTSISLPNVQIIRNSFLACNINLMSVEMPEVRIIEGSFLFSNKLLTYISLPKIEKIGHSFLCHNENIANDFQSKQKKLVYSY